MKILKPNQTALIVFIGIIVLFLFLEFKQAEKDKEDEYNYVNWPMVKRKIKWRIRKTIDRVKYGPVPGITAPYPPVSTAGKYGR